MQPLVPQPQDLEEQQEVRLLEEEQVELHEEEEEQQQQVDQLLAQVDQHHEGPGEGPLLPHSRLYSSSATLRRVQQLCGATVVDLAVELQGVVQGVGQEQDEEGHRGHRHEKNGPADSAAASPPWLSLSRPGRDSQHVNPIRPWTCNASFSSASSLGSQGECIAFRETHLASACRATAARAVA